MRCFYAVTLAILLSAQGRAQDTHNLTLREQLARPYVGLLELAAREYPRHEVRSLRASVEQNKEREIENCRKQQASLKQQLRSTHAGLKTLNALPRPATRTAADARANLHTQIAVVERSLQNKERECESTIPATFAVTLSKIDLLDRWPRQRERVQDAIEQGRDRQRKFGDVEDIGYRRIADDQKKDIPTGEQAIRQMAASGLMAPENQDPVVRGYIQDLGATVARHSDLKVPLHVMLVNDPAINAVAFPGGFLLLTSGSVLACETEAELAGIIAQEIARMAARHGTRASKRSIIAKMFVPAAQIATGLFTGGVANAGAYYGMDYGFQGLSILTDRAVTNSNKKAQKEADQLGIQYAWNTGFDPRGFITFLDSIAKKKEYWHGERFILAKSSLGERLVDAFSEILYLPQRESYADDSPEFRRVRARLQALQSE